jgi:hypothetical protein
MRLNQSSMLFLCALLIAFAFNSASGAAVKLGAAPTFNKDVLDLYKDQWAATERKSTDTESRNLLAKELLDMARQFGKTNPMTLLLCDKSQTLASRHKSGYKTASAALKFMQQVDPNSRIYCLEKLRGLYERLYNENRRARLGEGKGLAEVYLRMAESYMDELMVLEVEDEKIWIDTAYEALRGADRSYSKALGSAKGLSATARSYLNNPRVKAKQKEGLVTYLKGITKIEDRAKKGQTQVRSELSNWARLRNARARFEATNNAEDATTLVNYYVLLGHLEQAVNYVEHLDDKSRLRLVWSARPLETLETGQAKSLGDWYSKLADLAWADYKVDMLIRAKLYYERGGKELHAKLTLAKVDSALTKAGITEERAKKIARDVRYEIGAIQRQAAATAPKSNGGDADLIKSLAGDGPVKSNTPTTTGPKKNGGQKICKSCLTLFHPPTKSDTLCTICKDPKKVVIKHRPPSIKSCRKCFADFTPQHHKDHICNNCQDGNSSIFDFPN